MASRPRTGPPIRARRRCGAAVAATVALSFLFGPETAGAQACPAPLADARRLVLVTAERMNTTRATMQQFERATPDSAAVAALSGSAASEAAATKFARSGGLKTRKIDYIRAPTSSKRSQR